MNFLLHTQNAIHSQVFQTHRNRLKIDVDKTEDANTNNTDNIDSITKNKEMSSPFSVNKSEKIKKDIAFIDQNDKDHQIEKHKSLAQSPESKSQNFLNFNYQFKINEESVNCNNLNTVQTPTLTFSKRTPTSQNKSSPDTPYLKLKSKVHG